MKVDGYKTTVISDSSVSDTDHYMAQNDSELIGAMRFFDIKEVEGSSWLDLREDFDEKYTKSTGSVQGRFAPPTRVYHHDE